MKELIKKLVEITGPSGYETAVREAVRAEIAGLVDDIRVDALGNLIARKGSKTADGQRIMLSAHMDEIGIIATHIDENGFIRFTSIGGVRVANCIGGRVQFINGVRGLIYLEKLENPSSQPAMDQLYIDVGASSRANCPVKVGDIAAFERPFLDLNGRLVSKAMDDRISVAVMIEALRVIQSTPHEIFFVFSTQEEVGLRGATTAGFSVDPDIALAVDVTMAGDTPKGIKMEVSLGKGPAIKVRDGGMLADSRIVRWMADTAEKAGIPYQLEVLEGGTTDAKAIQLVRAGVLAGCLSIPTRYIHSPSEMVDLHDVEQAVRLLVELVSNPIHLQ
jgi:putative aminopeptidase FrvX